MQLRLMLLVSVCIYFITPLKAQDKFIDSSIASSKTNAEKHIIDNATDKVNKSIDNLFNGTAFRKKDKATKQDNAPVATDTSTFVGKGKTQIIISNTNYQTLASIADALKSNLQVTDVEKSFANNIGTLKVTYSCTSDQLLDDLVKKEGDKFEVSGMTEGKINLTMK